MIDTTSENSMTTIDSHTDSKDNNNNKTNKYVNQSITFSYIYIRNRIE